MSEPAHADMTWAFPEMKDFELELESQDGHWTTFRANESDLAAYVLSEPILIRTMLGGLYVTVEHDAVVQGGRMVKEPTRTRVRLTPKSWLGRERQSLNERGSQT